MTLLEMLSVAQVNALCCCLAFAICAVVLAYFDRQRGKFKAIVQRRKYIEMNFPSVTWDGFSDDWDSDFCFYFRDFSSC